MATFLFILSALSFFIGLLDSTKAETVFQQIVGAISFVMGAIFLIGAAIVNAINKLAIKEKKDPLRVLGNKYLCKYCKEPIRQDDKICPYCKESVA